MTGDSISATNPQMEINTIDDRIKLNSSWKHRLKDEFAKSYMKDLRNFLANELKSEKVIFPKTSEYFAALDHTSFEEVKVVILGQDPYHGPGQAHGLCFSVRPGVDVPPSLQNIFKEMKSDLGIQQPRSGYLVNWARQGVLLLNATLSVEEGKAGSHQGRGWENFTDRVIDLINRERSGVVFMLWGAYAQKKGQFIDAQKHLVLKAPHPSPLSAHRGFLGCRHFSQANAYLKTNGQAEIDWQLA